MAMRYRVNGPNIVSDVIDDEAVIVNLEKGTYYSLSAPGAEIWEALRAGGTVAQVQQLLTARYAGAAGDIAEAVDELVGEMVREGILVGEDEPGESTTAAVDLVAPAERPPFLRPVLHRYTDMEAILMLDPIHEVAETGWPAAKRPD